MWLFGTCNYVYLSYEPLLADIVMINYNVKKCRILIVALYCIFRNVKLKVVYFNKENCVQSSKFKLGLILHSNCDFYCPCTKYTHFEYVMQKKKCRKKIQNREKKETTGLEVHIFIRALFQPVTVLSEESEVG